MGKKQRMTRKAGRLLGDPPHGRRTRPRLYLKIFCCSRKWRTSYRERIPERVVHAKGSGAYGHFVCTNADMPK
jgi:catalase